MNLTKNSNTFVFNVISRNQTKILNFCCLFVCFIFISFSLSLIGKANEFFPTITYPLLLHMHYCNQDHPYGHGAIVMDGVKQRMLLKDKTR